MKLAVLGDPVAHSLSPLLHGAALCAVGLAGTYGSRRVDAAGMREAAEEVRGGSLDGANITMPHKHLAADLADRCSDRARRSGAVNTWVRVGDEIVGHNTDVAGVRNAWRWAGLPTGAPVRVLGAGGAAAAALLALEDRTIYLTARRAEAAAETAARVGLEVAMVPWEVPVAGAVVVNATPLGMHGEVLPEAVLEGASGVLDMAYGSEPTPAVRWAAGEGLPVADGTDMLLGQAIESFRLWTGRQAPLADMRSALDRELVRRAAASS